MEKLREIKLSAFTDERGTLTPIEISDFITFDIKRIYFLTDVLKSRGGHAVKNEKKLYVCQKGTIKARFHDGDEWHNYTMHGPTDAILMDGICFRDFYDFSKDAVLLAISSVSYNKEDYFYDLKKFIEYCKLNNL